MYELKTKKNDASVEKFLASVADPKKREDTQVILELMKKITSDEPKMWGSSIVGFGSLHYTYASGQEGDWFVVGFSPRKQNLTLYVNGPFAESPDLMEKLGKHKTGRSCIYINKLEDVDMKVLEKIIRKAIKTPGFGS